METYFEITISISEVEQELLIAQLYALGADSFVQEKDRIVLYLPSTYDITENIVSFLKEKNLSFEGKTCYSQDWNAVWESSFHPILIRDDLHIRAEFHPPVSGFKNELIIAPKMAFGTGHHATTYMILDWMTTIDFAEKVVLDFGCGTGILGLYAVQRGAAIVDFIDNDPNCIENVYEHQTLNHLTSHQVILGSYDTIPDESYHLILANITRNVILESLPHLMQHIKPKGIFAFSGFLKEDLEEMEKAMVLSGLTIIGSYCREEWCCLIVQNEGLLQIF